MVSLNNVFTAFKVAMLLDFVMYLIYMASKADYCLLLF